MGGADTRLETLPRRPATRLFTAASFHDDCPNPEPISLREIRCVFWTNVLGNPAQKEAQGEVRVMNAQTAQVGAQAPRIYPW